MNLNGIGYQYYKNNEKSFKVDLLTMNLALEL
jgi:hypothetical protein